MRITINNRSLKELSSQRFHFYCQEVTLSMSKEVTIKDTDLEAMLSYLKSNNTINNLRVFVDYRNPNKFELVAKVLTVLHETAITELILNSLEIEDKQVKSIFKVLRNTKIVTLSLERNKITAKGAKYIAKGLSFTKVTNLSLRVNKIGDKGVKALAKVLAELAIIELDLRENEIGIKGISILAEVLPDTKIAKLSLERNKIRDEGAKAIAEILPSTKIKDLNIRWNEIGDEGAKAIAKILSCTVITKLDLSINEIGDEGAKAIAEVLSDTVVRCLDLRATRIQDEGAKSLAESIIINNYSLTTILLPKFSQEDEAKVEEIRHRNRVLDEKLIRVIRAYKEHTEYMLKSTSECDEDNKCLVRSSLGPYKKHKKLTLESWWWKHEYLLDHLERFSHVINVIPAKILIKYVNRVDPDISLYELLVWREKALPLIRSLSKGKFILFHMPKSDATNEEKVKFETTNAVFNDPNVRNIILSFLKSEDLYSCPQLEQSAAIDSVTSAANEPDQAPIGMLPDQSSNDIA